MAEGGDAMGDLWWFLGIMLILGIFWLAGGGPERYVNGPAQTVRSPLVTKSYTTSYYDGLSVDGGNGIVANRSYSRALDYQKVRLGRGTASSATAANDEYITLTAPSGNSAPVNITGWFLTNSQGDKLLLKNNRFLEQPSVRLSIPTGAQIFDPAGNHVQGPITLNPGDRAYVITGTGKPFGDYLINTSFRVNKCLGFVEEANEYNLVPSLSSNYCPDIETEFDMNSLPEVCYDYVRSLSRCHVPEVTNKRDEGWRVDGRSDVPKACVNLVLPHLSYAACVNRHINDEDFFVKEWRVYLKQRWEMWDNRRETITLSDRNGNVIDQISY